MLAETDLAWAAGFIDGEGCLDVKIIRDRRVGAATRLPRHMPRVIVGQCDPRPLHRLQQMFGGNVRLRRSAHGRARKHWAWEVTGARQVMPMLTALRPDLMLKDEQAVVLMELCARYRSWGRGRRLPDAEIEAREQLAVRVRALKRE